MSAIPLAAIDPRAARQRLFRQVTARFTTGVTVVTTRIGDETFGMTANAFMAGSLEPLLCVVSINRTAHMHGRLRLAGHYGVSFLSQEQQHLAAHFGGKRLVGGLVPDFELYGPTPVLKHAVAALTADIVDSAECGAPAALLRRALRSARSMRTARRYPSARVLVVWIGAMPWRHIGHQESIGGTSPPCGTSTTNQRALTRDNDNREWGQWSRKLRMFERSSLRHGVATRSAK
jgi:flavin reductase (DIM6/NTAB) family NADH-FMN oxidoreductase RutF